MHDLASEMRSFDEKGFLGPVRLYAPEDAREMLKEIRARNSDRSRALYPDSNVNYDRHFDMPELSQLIGHPEVVKRLQGILGESVLCWRTEWFPKFPGTSGTEWHAVRDYSYASGIPQLAPVEDAEDAFFDLTVWTAFTEAHTETGCLRFIPGSHKRALFDEHKPAATGRTMGYSPLDAGTAFFGYRFAEFKIDPNWNPDDEETVAMEMEPGECVFFTARCVHGSFPNTTQRRTRFAIAARYVPTHVRVYPDQASFMAHGAVHALDDYGVVLVSGRDDYGHNRIRRLNNLGQPFPNLEGPPSAADFQTTDIQQQVTRVWTALLDLPSLRRDEDFFDLGAHSMLVAKAKGQLEAIFGREIPEAGFFRHTTCRSLAEFLQRSFAAEAVEAPVPA
jgi:non-haem Fe2+, alpha-ketoglutarate-dependent halogenase